MDAETAAIVQLARWAGEHALPLFFATLALLCFASGLAWWVLHLRRIQPWVGRLSPFALLVLWLLTGFAVIVGAAMGFAELAEELGDGEALGLADEAFTEALRHSVPTTALQVFAAVTRLGDPINLAVLGVLVAVALLAARRRVLALAWSLALAGNGVLNPTLKAVFERVRPQHDDGLVVADGFSFPSGHSSGAVVAFGMAAYLALRTLPPRWHLAAVLTAVAIAFTIGCSRMFLRVHFASDVMAGFASGTAWLGVCIAGAELARWLRQRPAVAVAARD